MKNVIRKNLPHKFPIRYALLVRPREENDDFDDFDFVTGVIKEREVLFRQLILSLQQKPLSKEMLLIQQTSIKFSILGVEIMNIAKIGKDPDWLESTKNKIKDILPNAEAKSWAFGEAFTLGLYSYRGNCEIPAFIRAYSYNSKDDFDSLYAKFGHYIAKSSINFFHDTYKKISEGKINEWELYKSLNQYEKPLHITSYQSDLWKMLDKGTLDGTISPEHLCQFETKEIKNLTENNNYTQKIPITVFKKWESLFAEEIIALYKMFRFCNNCGKALPFDYKGSYCPDTKENRKCVKKRARIRSRKRNITKKQSNL